MKDLLLKKLDLTRNGKHQYFLNGVWVPGVTSVSGVLPKDFLAPWASKMACETLAIHWQAGKAYTEDEIKDLLFMAKGAWQRKKTAAAEKGTTAHEIIEAYIKTKVVPTLPELTPEQKEVKNCVDNFLKWEADNKVEWLLVEQFVGSEKYQFAGQLDAVAIVNGKLCLVDFKTSNQIGMDFYLQTIGYQIALEEMGLSGIVERWILRFPKDKGGYEERLVPTSYENDKIAFLNALKIYNWIKYATKLDKELGYNKWK